EARRERADERPQQQGREAGPLEVRRGIRVKGELEERDGGDGGNAGDSARTFECSRHGLENIAAGLKTGSYVPEARRLKPDAYDLPDAMLGGNSGCVLGVARRW